MWKKCGMLLVGALLLTGCAAQPAEVAAEECERVSLVVREFNDSRNGDGTVRKVVAESLEAPVQRSGGGDSYDVRGTSTVTLEDGTESLASWNCFVQRPDSTSYAAITQWRLI